MTQRTKLGLLGGLLLVCISLIAIRVATAPEPQRVPLKFTSGQTQAQTSSDLPTLLRRERAKGAQLSFKPPKNIFAPLGTMIEDQRPRVAKAQRRTKEKPVAPVPAPPPVAAPQEPPPPLPEELVALQARQRMGQYRFLGYLARGGDRRAFLSKGRDIFIVRVGETVEGRFTVAAIDASSVRLRETSTSLETTLSLAKDSGSPF